MLVKVTFVEKDRSWLQDSNVNIDHGNCTLKFLKYKLLFGLSYILNIFVTAELNTQIL